MRDPCARLAALLERLLDCEAVVVPADETVLVLPTADTGGVTELLVARAVDGAVQQEIRLCRPPARAFGEREVLLCDLLRPHLSARLSHRDRSQDPSGRSALTQRQLEILGLVRCGLSNKEVARALRLTPATVRKHLQNAFVRLGVTSRTAAVAELFGGDSHPEADHV